MTRATTITAIALATAIPATAFAQAAGNAQLAAQIGVNADRFSGVELTELRSELEAGNREGVNLILTEGGSELTYDQLVAGIRDNSVNLGAVTDAVEPAGVMGDTNGGKEQIAAAMGVDADDFTLNQLVELRAAIGSGDDSEIRAILTEAGVDETVLSVN